MTDTARTVLVTGGSRGIGLACARAFAAAGHRVAVTFSSTPVDEAGILAVKCDISDPEQIDSAVSSVEDQPGAFVLSVVTGRRETGGTFFAFDGGVLDEAAPQRAEPQDRGLTLHLKKSDLLTRPPASLRGVLTLDSGASHEISVPVGAASRKGR